MANVITRRGLLAGVLVLLGSAASGAEAEVSYRRDVAPILRRHCWGCHTSKDPQGGLNMDTVAAFAEGGARGPAWKAGKPDDSLVLQMVAGLKKPAMPYKEPPLSDAKVQIIRKWILEGARDDSPKAADQVVIPKTYRVAPAVTSVAFSPDGRLVAAACRSEVVVLPADGQGEPQRLATQSDLLTYVGFSPDGKTLASAGGTPGAYGEVCFFEVGEGAVKPRASRRLGADTLFRGGFSPDGSHLALGGADGAVHVVPVSGDGPARKYDLHSDWVSDVCYSPDGQLLFSAGRDRSVKVAAAETGKLLRTIAAPPDYVNAVAASDGLALSAGRDRVPAAYTLKQALASVTLQGAGNGTKPVLPTAYTRRLEAQPGEVFALSVSADRKLMAVAGAYGEARVYQVADGKRVAALSGLPAPVYGVALSADGSRLAAGGADGTVRIYDVPQGKLLRQVAPVPVAAAAQ
jgi:WD40 repeat protein